MNSDVKYLHSKLMKIEFTKPGKKKDKNKIRINSITQRSKLLRMQKKHE